MEIVFAWFGGRVAIGARGDGDAVHVRADKRWLRWPVPDGAATALDGPGDIEPPALGPFTRAPFGKTDRLAWVAGACAISKRAYVVYWDERFAAVVDGRGITVIDGLASRQVRLEGLPFAVTSAAARDRRLAIATDTQIIVFELAALVGLLDGDARALELRARSAFPLRDRDNASPGRIAWVLMDGNALINVGTRQLRLRVPPARFETGQAVTLYDELWPGQWARLDDVRLVEPDATATVRIKLVRGRSKDPQVTAPAVDAGDRQAEVDALLAQLARDPDDDAPRAVLVDVLNELDASYGTAIAVVRADATKLSPAVKKTVLGPLVHFFDDVVYRAGLPWAAKLRRKVPADPALLDAALGDLRLGMLHRITLGSARPDLYARFVGSPRAVGLRHADIGNRAIASALVDAGRDQLTHLHEVRFAQEPVIELLAKPTFDRVTHVEAIVQCQHLASWLDRIARDPARFFARARRTLIVREQFHHEDDAVIPIMQWWKDLPVDRLVIGRLELVRDAAAVVTLPASGWTPPWLARVRDLVEVSIVTG